MALRRALWPLFAKRPISGVASLTALHSCLYDVVLNDTVIHKKQRSCLLMRFYSLVGATLVTVHASGLGLYRTGACQTVKIN